MIVVKRLVWETSNIEHIARHDVTQEEVEQACHGRLLVKDARGDRVMVFGSTKTDRVLCIILDPEIENDTWYPVTARSADRGERKKYFKEMEEVI